MTTMSAGQLNAFMRAPRIATLVTLSREGSPMAVPVWYEWDGERARVFTSRNSSKIARIRRDPRVCLSIAEPAGVPEAWVTIEGEATVEEHGGYDLAQRLAPRYYEPEKAARVLREWAEMAEQWVVLSIAPRRLRSMAPG